MWLHHYASTRRGTVLAMAEAGWKPDPSGTHEWRWWDGSAWSDHVSDGGVQSSDPLTDLAVPPPADDAAAATPVEPTADVAPKKGGGWKDKLKQAAEQGKQLADQAKTKIAEQQAQRLEQLKNDPETLWFGVSQNPATKATGVSKAVYRITKDRIWIDTGVLGTRSEHIPMWAIRDIDVRQSVLQRGKDVGDVALWLEDPAYSVDQGNAFGLSGQPEAHMSGAHTSGEVLLDNIEGPYAVRDLLMPLVSEARHKKLVERQSQYINVNPVGGIVAGSMAPPPSSPVADPGPQVDVADQLRKLAELRDQGILTDEEFAAQKAKLLG
jgi:hypothetical protein